jgi:hypothetical protein
MLQDIVQDYILDLFCIEIQVAVLMQDSTDSSCSLDSSLSIELQQSKAQAGRAVQ